MTNNKFRAVTSSPDEIKNVMQAIEKVNEEITLQADKDGITINSIDRGHIMYTSIYIEEQYFDIYDCTDKVTFSIDVAELNKRLKRAKKDDVLLLSLAEDQLDITLEGETKRYYHTRILDGEYEVPRSPEIEYPVTTSIKTGILREVLKDVEVCAEKVRFTIDEDKITFESVGDYGSCSIEYMHGDSISGVYSSAYQLENISHMLIAGGISENAVLKWGDDMPLTLQLDNGYGLRVGYLLAPRIEEEE